MKRCPDCGLVLPVAHETRTWRPAGCPYQRLRAELMRTVTSWTDDDDRMTRWLAGYDERTTEWVRSLVRRAIATRARDAPHKVACVACGRVVVASKNGHPRRHSPHHRLEGRAMRVNTGHTCDGTFMPGEAP